MLFRFFSVLVLTATCGTAFSQQNLELNLDKFPEKSENEQPAREQPAIEQNSELQLDLKQFDQQQESKDLELNLEQFNDKAQTDRTAPTNNQVGNNQTENANNNSGLNLEQFDKDDTLQTNGGSTDIKAESTSADKPAGKINTTGSAARKIGNNDGAEQVTFMDLLKESWWLLALAFIVFLLIRSRIRKRRRARPPGTKQHRPTYSETDHR